MTFHQNYVILILAGLFSLLIWLSVPIWHGPDLLARTFYAAALFLLARDVIAGVAISRGPRVFKNPNRWVYAFYHALYFGIFMMLFNWQGPLGIVRLSIAASIGAVLFAGIMSFLYYGRNHQYKHHFDTKNIAANGKFWRAVFFIWPILTIGCLVFLINQDNVTAATFFAPLLLIGFLIPQFSRIRRGSYIWTNLPRIVGYGMLLLAFSLSFLPKQPEETPNVEQIDPSVPQPIYEELTQ